eukprot:15466251-Alexandrium_andersonii.AAC.1
MELSGEGVLRACSPLSSDEHARVTNLGEEEGGRRVCNPVSARPRGAARPAGYESTLEGAWWRRVTLADLHGN